MRSLKFKVSAIPMAVMLSACGSEEAAEQAVSSESSAKTQQVVAENTAAETLEKQSEAEKANAIYEAYWEENLKMNPLNATFMGDDRYNDTLGDFGTEKGRAEALAFSKKYLEKINQIDESELEGQALLSYQIFKNEREAEIEGTKYPDYMQPIQQFFLLTLVYRRSN